MAFSVKAWLDRFGSGGSYDQPTDTGSVPNTPIDAAGLRDLETRLSGYTDTHIADTSAAHAASAISVTPAGTISSTNVGTALTEVATDAAALVTAEAASRVSADAALDTRVDSLESAQSGSSGPIATEAVFTGHSLLGQGATQERSKYPIRIGRALGCAVFSGGEGGAKAADAGAGVTYPMGWPNIGALLARSPAVAAEDLAALAQLIGLDYGANENSFSATSLRNGMLGAITLGRAGSRQQGAHASISGTGGYATIGAAGSVYKGVGATNGPGCSRVRGPGGVGATLTITTPSWYPGGSISALAALFISTDATGGLHSVTIDGSSAGTHDARTPTDGIGFLCPTVKIFTDTISAGAHTIVFTVTAIAGGTGSYFDSSVYEAIDPPLIIISNMTPPSDGVGPQPLNAVFDELAAEYTDGKVAVFDRYTTFKATGDAPALTVDGLHLNDSGTGVAATGWAATAIANSDKIPPASIHDGRVTVTPTAPSFTGTPTITGTAALSGTLTAHATVIGTSPITLTYRWMRDGTPIAGATASTHTVVSGDVGHEVSVEVTADNGVGSPAVGTSDPVTPTAPTVPGAPTGLTLTPGDTVIGATWTAPVSDGGSDLITYLVEWRSPSGSGSYTTFVHSASTTPSITITGVPNDVQAGVRVSAVNAVGTGTATAEGTATPASAVAPFDFDDVTAATLIGWIDASKESFSNDALVATATDWSAGGHNGTQATAAAKPIFKTNVQNGLPGFLFDPSDGTADSLAMALSQATKPFTFVGVIRPTVDGNYRDIWGASAGGGWQLRHDPDGHIQLQRDATANVFTTTGVLADGVSQLVVITYSNAGAWTCTIDGVNAGSGTADQTPGAATTVIGNNTGGSEPWKGMFHAGGWYNGNLAGTSDLTSLKGGLKSKWATA